MDSDSQFCDTDIYRGIVNASCETVLQAIKNGDDVNRKNDVTGETYLHLIMKSAAPITERSFVPMIYQLSNADINLNETDLEGSTPLELSISGTLLELMVALLKCGADADDRAAYQELIMRKCKLYVEEFMHWFQKLTPGYWNAVENHKHFKVNILVKGWCRVNLSRRGKCLIEHAKEQGVDNKTLRLLMEHEASIELAHSTIAGDRERMELFINCYPVNMFTKDMLNRKNYLEPFQPLSLYEAAEKYGQTHVLDLLRRAMDAWMINNTDHTRRLYPDDNDRDTSSTLCAIL